VRPFAGNGGSKADSAKRWKRNSNYKGKTAFMFEGKKAFPHSDNL
jgi:hypothetical protein